VRCRAARRASEAFVATINRGPIAAAIWPSADSICIDVELRLMPPPSDPQLSVAQLRRLLNWLAREAP
jgi:hypothetical protein